jgi:energy-converting hydrogenase B subunit D
MAVLNVIIVLFLVGCALAIERTKDLLAGVVIFAAYSLKMSLLWLLLKAPDVALTEAAVGAGLTSLLFLAVISRTERYER